MKNSGNNRRRKRQVLAKAPAQPTCWTLAEYARAARFGLSTWYVLPKECLPEHTKVGRRIIVTEPPAVWLQRMAARGGVPTSSAT